MDGQAFEVHPEDKVQSPSQTEPSLVKPVELSRPLSISGAGGNEMTAPLPGTVIEIFIKAGDQIEAGQVILIIEAMKMKNSIRSRRAGKIAEVLVSAGQTVAHKQALVRFE